MQDIDLTILNGKMFRHFKGDLYLFIDIAENSETGENMVIYKALYGVCKVYARPLESFLDEVDKVKYPNVTQKYRFEQVNIESSK